MSTPHLQGQKGDYADIVLMPGDPLRAQFIAEHYLENVTCVNTIRNMLGFTGTYQGIPVSVQGSGMGQPSIGIYSYELYHFFGVKSIIRIGTAGGIAPEVKLRDVILGQAACTNSNFAAQYQLPGTYAPIASFRLLKTASDTAEELGLSVRTGNLLSSDTFYDDAESLEKWAKMHVLGIEMESAALYMNAARAGAEALCICTVSDCPLRKESTSAEERQTGFTDMMRLALETVKKLSHSKI
ncbi:MAG: purine-nucleoside phosphorylase [Oscillospiraceae bacterium]|nr:purine-nucleoside phosphorylase [Oscillospiraceae bacterium]